MVRWHEGSLGSETQEIRIRRESPVDDLTTTLNAHPIYDGGTEIGIEQTKFDHFKKRYSPSKLIYFTLSPQQRRQLIEILEEQDSIQKRAGRDVSANEAGSSTQGNPETSTPLPRPVEA